MTKNLKISLAVALTLIVGAVVLIAVSGSSDEEADTTTSTTTSADESAAPPTVRPDTHKLSVAKDGKVTLVEFLDFECEACGALFPAMEELRSDYDGKITIAVRYFPLPNHTNAQIAAQAVEAASKQDKFEQMYKKMFETQSEWGESQDSKREVFIGFARELGLDMTEFLNDLDDPSTAERVRSDQADGEALGVQGTPTLFLNDEMLQINSIDELRSQIDEALAQ